MNGVPPPKRDLHTPNSLSSDFRQQVEATADV